MRVVAWFQASSAINLSMTSSDTETYSVSYTEFGTSVADLAVTLEFEETTDSKVNGLVTYLDSDPDTTGPKVAGWNQCYLDEAGNEVWNAAEPPAGAYGNGANAYYRVFRVKATFTPTDVQKASTIANHFVKGSVSIVDSLTEGSAKFWTATSALNADGKTSTPANAAALTAAAKAFVSIDITANQASWTVDALNTVYSTTYVGVVIDGAVHTTNVNVTATLSFSSVATGDAA